AGRKPHRLASARLLDLTGDLLPALPLARHLDERIPARMRNFGMFIELIAVMMIGPVMMHVRRRTEAVRQRDAPLQAVTQSSLLRTSGRPLVEPAHADPDWAGFGSQ